MNIKPGRYAWMMLGVFTLAMLVRLAVVVCFVGLDSPPKGLANPDQLDYELFAYHLSEGKGYTLDNGAPTAMRPPGTSLALWPVYAVFGRSWAAGRLWLCLLSAVTCVAAAALVQPFLGKTVALLTALGLALYPGHFYYVLHFVSETPSILLVTLAMWATVQAGRMDKRWWDTLAGVLWGLAILTRPQVVLLAPIALVMILWMRSEQRWDMARRWAVQLAIAMLVVSPWVVRNAVVMNKPTLSTVGGHTFWGGNNEMVLADRSLQGTWIKTTTLREKLHPIPPGEIAGEAAAWRHGWQFIQSHRSDMPRLTLMKLYRLIDPFPDTPNRGVYWAFTLSWLIVAPLAAIGLWLCWQQSRMLTALLLLPIAGTVLTAMIFYGNYRFRDANAPFFLALAAIAIRQGWMAMQGKQADDQGHAIPDPLAIKRAA